MEGADALGGYAFQLREGGDAAVGGLLALSEGEGLDFGEEDGVFGFGGVDGWGEGGEEEEGCLEERGKLHVGCVV